MIAALLIYSVLGVVGAVAAVAAAYPVPKVRECIVGLRRSQQWIRGAGRKPRGRSPRSCAPSVAELLLPERNVAHGRGRTCRRASLVRLHQPRQRLAEPVSRIRSIGPPRRLRLNPRAGGNDATHQVFGAEPDRGLDQAREGRVRPAPSPCYESGTPSRNCPRARSTRRSSAWTTSPRGSSTRRRRRHRRGDGRAPRVRQSVLGEPVHRRDLADGARRTTTSSGSRAARPRLHRQMDPAASSGFQRLVVLREGLASADVLAGARGPRATAARRFVPGSPDCSGPGSALDTDLQGPDRGRRQGDAPDPVQGQGSQ